MRYRPLSDFSKTFFTLAEILAKKNAHEIVCETKEAALDTREYLYHFRYALRRTAANGALTDEQQQALATLNEYKTKVTDNVLTLYRKPKLEIANV